MLIFSSFSATVPAAVHAKGDASLRWGSCPPSVEAEPDIRCGWLELGSSGGKPSATLRIVVLEAPRPDPDVPPVVYIPGGPGAAPDLTPAGLRRWLAWRQQARWPADIILFDPAGTGQSFPAFACPEAAAARAEAADKALTAKLEYALEYDALRACYTRLGAERVETLSAGAQVDNIAALLDAMALMQVNLWGVSYGTRLALLFAADYPERVRSIVLDSIIPFFINDLGSYPEQVSMAIERLDSACAESRRCARAGVPSAHLAVLLERYEDAPAHVEFDHAGRQYTLAVTPYRMLLLVLFSNYSADKQAAAAQRLMRAAAGNAQALEPMAERLWRFVQTPARSDAVFWSTRCSVAQAALTQAEWRRRLAPYPMVAPYLAPAWDYRICAFWQMPRTSARPDESALDMPMLVLAGARDAVTPAAWGRRFVEKTPTARLAVLAGQAHVPSLTHACAMGAVALFLKAPEHDRLPECVNTTAGADG